MQRLISSFFVLCLAAPLFASALAADELGAARADFRTALKSDKWQDRQDAYVVLAGYDSKAAAEEALRALAKEKNAAVVYSAVKVLSRMTSAGAKAAYTETLRKGKPKARHYVLMALNDMNAEDLLPVLHEVLTGKDAAATALAAMALGRRQSVASIPQVLPLLEHKAWQVRRGAALALLDMATPPAPPPAPGTNENPPSPPPPAEAKSPEVVQALVAALAAGEGTERRPMLRALARITGQDYGLDLAAWKQLAAGTAPDAIKLKPVKIPHIFGIPIFGRRVVVVMDRSLRMDDGVPFDAKRKAELCLVPGAKPIVSRKLYRARQFTAAHIRRMFKDMDKSQRLELVYFDSTVERVFGKFIAPSASSAKRLKEALKDIQIGDGLDTYGALTQGLDVAGSKDAKAWKSGPDEIIFVTVNVPTTGEIVDPDVIAPAIALKARARLVMIHTVGINTHAYEMLRTIAGQTGGTYRDYHK